MTARDDILGAVRAALGAAAPADSDVPRGYRHAEQDVDLVALFAERVADYRATVTQCTEPEVQDAIRTALGGAKRVLVPGGFDYVVDNAVTDEHLSAAELDAVDAVVTQATVGIATTGTIVLDHGPGQGRRALTLVPDQHVCVIHTGQIVPDVPQAVERLDPLRPQTWISGPSATSDIELNRVEGVHGPRHLHVIIHS